MRRQLLVKGSTWRQESFVPWPYDFRMNADTKKKTMNKNINSAANYYRSRLPESMESKDIKPLLGTPKDNSLFDGTLKGRRKALFSGYHKDMGYPEPLARFLADAQNCLAGDAERLNDTIDDSKQLEKIRENLEQTLTVLGDFDDAIKNTTGCRLDCTHHDSLKLLKEAVKTIQTKPASWSEPEQKVNDFLLGKSPLFSLKTPKIAEEKPQEQKKRLYTVFVGSTYDDMKDIRAAVLQELNSSEDYIPIGMEDFTAANGRQLPYIKDRLKDTDIYVLILGGRYGSLIPKDDKDRPDEEDKSYTQKEYELAMADPDIKVLAFLYSNPGDLPEKKRWKDDKEHELLTKFIKKVKADRLAKFWHPGDTPDKIAAYVYQSLTQMNKSALRGWVRGTSGSSAK